MAITVNSSVPQWVGFVSFLVWVPYSLLLLLLTREHSQRRKFPQNLILGLLSASCACRAVWFFLYDDYGQTLPLICLNRVAILLQFSALSILMLMWVKALEITAFAKSLGQHHASQSADTHTQTHTQAKTKARANTKTQTQQAQAHTLKRTHTQGSAASSASSQSALSRWQSVKHSHSEALLHLRSQQKQANALRLCIAINVFVWAGLLGSLARSDDDNWYAGNIFAIVCLCLLQAVLTLVIGLRTAVVLQRELSATTVQLSQHAHSTARSHNGMSGGGNGRKSEHSRASRGVLRDCVRAMCVSCNPFYRLFFSREDEVYGLQIQRDVVRTILSVSIVVFFFFFLRAFAFLYRPLVKGAIDSHTDAGKFGQVLYPLFFYQLPESIPNLAIALGIAPPKSLIRMLYRLLTLRRGVNGEPHPLAPCATVCARTLCGWEVCVSEGDWHTPRMTERDAPRYYTSEAPPRTDNRTRKNDVVRDTTVTFAENLESRNPMIAARPDQTTQSALTKSEKEKVQPSTQQQIQESAQRDTDDRDSSICLQISGLTDSQSSLYRTSSLFGLRSPVADLSHDTPAVDNAAINAESEIDTRNNLTSIDLEDGEERDLQQEALLSRVKRIEYEEKAELIYEIQSMTTSSQVNTNTSSIAGSLKLRELLERASGRSERESDANAKDVELAPTSESSREEREQREREKEQEKERERLKNEFVGSRPWNRKFWT